MLLPLLVVAVVSGTWWKKDDVDSECRIPAFFEGTGNVFHDDFFEHMGIFSPSGSKQPYEETDLRADFVFVLLTRRENDGFFKKTGDSVSVLLKAELVDVAVSAYRPWSDSDCVLIVVEEGAETFIFSSSFKVAFASSLRSTSGKSPKSSFASTTSSPSSIKLSWSRLSRTGSTAAASLLLLLLSKASGRKPPH